ncbi:alpha/beta fold hydrolase [Micromonospora avicenniae]|uniref:alpha/beta fold hydrolase n=1 Tax=Micromonospora avicenniae TaxID=1198245 RepID=UPI003430A3A1
MSRIEYARLPALRVAYRVWGPADGRALVALHGGGTTGATWSELAGALDGVRTYAPDLRGFGATDRPGRYGLELMRDDLRAFLDTVSLPRVTVLGHSSGAVAAYLLAQAHPERVAALVLAEPPPPVPLGLRLPDRPAVDPPYDWAARTAVVAELNDPPPEWWERLTQITSPTLLVSGGASSHLPQRELARMADRIPAARLVRIDGGHAVHTARPAEFRQVVRDFLASTAG